MGPDVNPETSLLERDSPGRVVMAGDWHGNRAQAVTAVRESVQHLADENVKIILQAGDFGIWSGQAGHAYRHELSRVLAEVNATLCFIDGNHEDFDLLQTLRGDTDPDAPAEIGDRIWHLPRGLRWTWHDREWLALGGAASPDRDIRLRNGWGWWEQERITGEDIACAVAETDGSARPAQVMITHEAPLCAPVRYLDPAPSSWLAQDLVRGEGHRMIIEGVARAVQADYLIHGHHHQGYQANVGPGLEVTGLDMDGNPGNWGILDTVTMTWGTFGPGNISLVRRD
jgi:predicted phosphodiesterase